MSLRAWPFRDMAGSLTLVDPISVLNPDTPIDLLNVRVEAGGGVASRGGSEDLSDFDAAAAYHSMVFSSAGATDHLVAANGANLRAIGMDGASDASQGLSDSELVSFARYGAPGTERVYYAQGTDIGYWDGSTFTHNPATLPRPVALCVTPWDNRLAAIGYRGATSGPSGAASSPSTIHFSNEGDPAGWDANQRETLYPGDGEELVCGVTWRDRMFVFKQSRFFVFFGTTDTGGGIEQFEYYAVDARAGVDGPLAACAGRDGVYFVNQNGVYRTDGNEPQLISGGLDPIFRGESSLYFRGSVGDPNGMNEASITFAAERLHVGLPLAGGGRVSLVYDPRYDWWGYDDLPIACGAVARLNGEEQLLYGDPGSLRVKRHHHTLLDDSGAEIEGRWRSGWHDFGVPDYKRIRHSRLMGSGTVSLGYSVDGGQIEHGGVAEMDVGVDEWADGTDGSDLWAAGDDAGDLWGAGVRYSEDWVRRVPVRGRLWSWQFSGVGQWSVQLAEHHVPERSRRPAVDTKA